MAQKDKKRNYGRNGNREYKSDVISMMLQIPEYALDVYNAMNDSAYTDPDMIQIMRLENESRYRYEMMLPFLSVII